jgi:two-component system response regulator DesR
MSAGDIAEHCNSSQAPRNYLSEAIGKLGVGNRIEGTGWHVKVGWPVGDADE